MAIIEQEIAARKAKLELNKAMRNRILKILAEPYTNSDQIYKDAIKEGNDPDTNNVKPIFIYVNRKEKEFSIVDYGESMDKEELLDRFSQRGQKQKTHHKKSRSIFGQGLSDLMFSRECGGTINCIKGDLFHPAKFRSNEVKSEQTGKPVLIIA